MKNRKIYAVYVSFRRKKSNIQIRPTETAMDQVVEDYPNSVEIMPSTSSSSISNNSTLEKIPQDLKIVRQVKKTPDEEII